MIAKSDGRRADGPDCDAACPNFVHSYILVVNKSLSVEVPDTGRFWLHYATEQNNVTAQMSKTTTSITTTADDDASAVTTPPKVHTKTGWPKKSKPPAKVSFKLTKLR